MVDSGVRSAAVAGVFYPGEAVMLAQMVDAFLAALPEPEKLPRCPKAFVVPHAGLVYSGPVAAYAYQQIQHWQHSAGWRRVVVLGPNHRVPLSGLAGVEDSAWQTPLGRVSVDTEFQHGLQRQFDLQIRPDAHRLEHCIEVQLPFLQQVLPEASLMPLLVGQAPVQYVASLIQYLWSLEGVLVLISSDLSHYHPWQEARQLDRATSKMICNLQSRVQPEQACGCYALNGLLKAARAEDLTLKCLHRATSGDTAGDKASVVGYGAYVCY